MRRHLIVDVEAVAIADVETYLEEPSAPSNYKDEAKIAAYIAEQKKAQADRAALDIDLARLVAIGTRTSSLVEVHTIKDEVSEMYALQRFWDTWGALDSTIAVTFNGLGYDLPLLLRRSLYLGVKAPKLQLERFKHPEVIDLMQVLSLDGRLKIHGLRFYANRFGIPVNDEITGGDIAQCVRDGDWAAVERHCAADVETTYLLAKRIGVLDGVLAAERVA